MTLYTTRGDDGTTALFGSKDRISKTSAIAEALGTVDELNAVIGLVRASYRDLGLKVGTGEVSDILYQVQEDLFVIQAELAGADKHIERERVEWLEEITDSIEQVLQPIRTFLLPGAEVHSAQADIARTVSRRAERRVVEVAQADTGRVGANTLAYCNRLSSLLYAIVRVTNDRLGGEEIAPSY